jgi:hypothetical protein
MTALVCGALCVYSASLRAAGQPAAPPLASSPDPTSHAKRWFAARKGLVPARREPSPPASADPNPITDADFNSCKRPPSGKRVVPLTLKPDTDVTHLIVWISSITCKTFVLSGSLGASSKRVTIIAPALITPERAYNLFLEALNSVGLTVEPWGKFYQVIETAKAKSKPIPLYDWNGHRLAGTAPP